MLFQRHFLLQALLTTLGFFSLGSGLAAEPPDPISLFASATLDRTVYGDDHAFELSLRGRRLGRANAFAGVDGLSGANQQYLTSGLQWRSGSSDTPWLRLAALQTEQRRGSIDGAQTLLRAANHLDLGSRWYMPVLSTEVAQVSNNSKGSGVPWGGRALRIGVMETFGPADFRLDYFQADPHFNALGSDVVAGDRGFGLESTYHLTEKWRLSHDVRLHQATASHEDSSVVQKWLVRRTPTLTDIGRAWRLSAQIGSPRTLRSRRGTPVALKLASQTARWRRWRLDTSLGWYGRDTATPLGLPVAGTLWQVSARRGLSIAGLRTELSPSFALGGSRYPGVKLGSRAGFRLGFSELSDSVDLRVDYRSRGWGRAKGREDGVQMSLNFTQRTSAIMPNLSSMVGRLRLPWQPRLP